LAGGVSAYLKIKKKERLKQTEKYKEAARFDSGDLLFDLVLQVV
jgi:hypothetical protein